MTRAGVERSYLAYGDNGMRLVYAGDDRDAWEAACAELGKQAAGYVSGYQFVGRTRYELRAYFDVEPTPAFLTARYQRDLFELAWHPRE